MSQHAMAGCIGGHTTWSRHDRHEGMARVRAAKEPKLRARVLEADPALTDEAEIARRIESLRKADQLRLTLAATRARRAAAEARRIAAEADLELDATGLDQAGSDGVDLDS